MPDIGNLAKMQLPQKRGREIFYRVLPALCIIEKIYRVFPIMLREHWWYRKSQKSGLWQIGLRWALLKSISSKVGLNVRINEDCYIKHPSKLSIGNNVSIWPMTYIECAGGVYIGNDVSIAHSVTIMSEEHKYESHDLPIKDQGIKYAAVYIEDDVWIGAKATILSGVRIGKGAIIGAGAVVVHDIPENAVAVGVPAKVKKYR